MKHSGLDRYIGLGLAVLAIAVIFIWIPADSETGLVVQVRRRVLIGDALAPTVAAVLCLVFAVLLAVLRPADGGGKSGGGNKPAKPEDPGASMQLRGFIPALLVFIIGFGVVLAAMRYAGPLAVAAADLFTAADLSYRPLRGTVPVKYTGFVIGGGMLIGGVACYIERRFSWRRLGTGFAIALLIALLFDLPFDDILLPPNGDV